ncbi:MAG: TatD family hydrolase [Ginsengibacter sp.]
MKIIDTHTHLYLNDFKDDIDHVMLNAFAENVEEFYLPAIDSGETASMLSLESKYPGKCFAMMGLHPCSVKGNYKDELLMVSDWLNKRRFAAIGETGLDFFWDKTFVNEQYESFNRQIEWALQYNLPVIIHTRNAIEETIEVVKKFTSKNIKGIFHCFSGNHQNALDIIKAGFLLGIGGVVTYKNAGVAEAIKEIDLSYIVVETDSPYLTPVPFRGKRNESGYIKYVIKKLAEIKNISEEEVAAITTANAERIFTGIHI